MGVWMAAIDEALADLDSGVEEVAREMGDLAARVESGELNVEQVAGEIRARAARLRDIRPDEVVPGDESTDQGSAV